MMRVVVVALLLVPRLVAGQSGDGANPLGLGATRQALEARAQRLEAARSAGAAQEAAAIRTRLARGDFRVGDRILMIVEGESALSDTFVAHLNEVVDLDELPDPSPRAKPA